MEDSKWFRLLTIGLVLAALAVGYFLFTGKFSSNSATRRVAQVVASPSPSITPASPVPTSTPKVSPTPSATPSSAYNTIANRTKGGVQTLPRTGFPLDLTAILSVSVMISGWGLRKFPH
ncbi:hypothetical protein A3I48_01825 [Candidatus Daviesbacteria bacterium RIFCSPLOWO2_02_FULL_36_7]|uniref:Uncharacterized protein n=1 Tax=Candidatus Daviesbacteria bacterium RIFCSPLOWO2_02_FULL_36_7 TaxID=1797792 RepID=A0A1F5MHR9_9BACT|nr:MAG: hypothetical protein A3I48_01825 [Candidatus Daviesbacteria bacterium RIFCSPLOWO2_02_FULL_36_7]